MSSGSARLAQSSAAITSGWGPQSGILEGMKPQEPGRSWLWALFSVKRPGTCDSTLTSELHAARGEGAAAGSEGLQVLTFTT